MSEEERRLTAYHEGGHALVGYALPKLDPIHKVTIIPRGRAGGYTMALPLEDKHYEKRSELVDQLAYALGGRTAEEIVFGDPSTGASNDIEKATSLARKMVMEYGMSDRLGPLKYGQPQAEVFLGRDYAKSQDLSNEVAAAIDDEVRKLITQAHEEAMQIIVTHRDALDRIAEYLLEHETADAERVIEMFHDVPKWEHSDTGALRIKGPEGAGDNWWDCRSPDRRAQRRVTVTISPITWNLESRSLTNADHTLVMGVVNTTPDSFSDGGQWAEPRAAIRRGFKLWDDGADLVDVGGESTRPGAEPVSVEEELARVVPVVEALASHGIIVSIDTSKVEVAAAAVAAGAEIVNDVTGLTDPDMANLCEETGVGVVIMHMQGDPRSMQANPTYDNVVADVAAVPSRSHGCGHRTRNRGLADRC